MHSYVERSASIAQASVQKSYDSHLTKKQQKQLKKDQKYAEKMKKKLVDQRKQMADKIEKDRKAQLEAKNQPSIKISGSTVWSAAAHGTPRDLESRVEAANMIDPQGYSPLHYAVMFAREENVAFLTSLPFLELNATDKQGRTPLFIACENQNKAICRYLVLAGAKTSRDAQGRTPFGFFEAKDSKFIGELTELAHQFRTKKHIQFQATQTYRHPLAESAPASSVDPLPSHSEGGSEAGLTKSIALSLSDPPQTSDSTPPPDVSFGVGPGLSKSTSQPLPSFSMGLPPNPSFGLGVQQPNPSFGLGIQPNPSFGLGLQPSNPSFGLGLQQPNLSLDPLYGLGGFSQLPTPLIGTQHSMQPLHGGGSLPQSSAAFSMGSLPYSTAPPSGIFSQPSALESQHEHGTGNRSWGSRQVPVHLMNPSQLESLHPTSSIVSSLMELAEYHGIHYVSTTLTTDAFVSELSLRLKGIIDAIKSCTSLSEQGHLGGAVAEASLRESLKGFQQQLLIAAQALRTGKESAVPIGVNVGFCIQWKDQLSLLIQQGYALTTAWWFPCSAAAGRFSASLLPVVSFLKSISLPPMSGAQHQLENGAKVAHLLECLVQFSATLKKSTSRCEVIRRTLHICHVAVTSLIGAPMGAQPDASSVTQQLQMLIKYLKEIESTLNLHDDYQSSITEESSGELFQLGASICQSVSQLLGSSALTGGDLFARGIIQLWKKYAAAAPIEVSDLNNLMMIRGFIQRACSALFQHPLIQSSSDITKIGQIVDAVFSAWGLLCATVLQPLLGNSSPNLHLLPPLCISTLVILMNLIQKILLL